MQQIQRYFRKAGKALARFFGRVKKGSPIDIAILVCAAALIIALLAILVMSLLPDAAPVDASSSAPSSSARRTLTKRCFWAIPTPTVWWPTA